MINLIRSEIIKVRSVRSTVVLLAAAAGLVVLIAVLQANDIKDEGTANLGDITAGVTFAAFLFGALGVQVIGQEYRFNTIRTTLAAAPIRWRVLLAKLVVAMVACAVVAVVMMAMCVIIGSVMLSDFEIDGLDHRVIFGTALFAAGWSAMGLGVGAIVRQPIAGIMILLGEGFVAEGIVANIFPATAKWMPFLNGIQMTSRSNSDGGDIVYRSVLGGGIYFFVVVAVVLAIGAFLATKRDA